jgi:hypothetical protein
VNTETKVEGVNLLDDEFDNKAAAAERNMKRKRMPTIKRLYDEHGLDGALRLLQARFGRPVEGIDDEASLLRLLHIQFLTEQRDQYRREQQDEQ